jgi:glycosyltransferase involved in cell wall biosynthesis
VVDILTNKELAQRLATNAKQLVVEEYSWSVISRQLDKIYQELGGA